MPLCSRANPTTDVPADAVSPRASHAYVGLWATEDGYIRQTLLADGQYEEARGPRVRASRGRYRVENDRIEYVEHTSGFTENGRFESGVLYHAGMVLYRCESEL